MTKGLSNVNQVEGKQRMTRNLEVVIISGLVFC